MQFIIIVRDNKLLKGWIDRLNFFLIFVFIDKQLVYASKVQALIQYS